MLAARLCYAWGIEDVPKWIDETPPEILDFWTAFDKAEPIGQEWRQTAEVISKLHELLSALAAKLGVEVAVLNWDAFMPPRFVRLKKLLKATEVQSVESQRNILRGMVGKYNVSND